MADNPTNSQALKWICRTGKDNKRSGQLSAVSYQLSAISYQLLAFSFCSSRRRALGSSERTPQFLELRSSVRRCGTRGAAPPVSGKPPATPARRDLRGESPHSRDPETPAPRS